MKSQLGLFDVEDRLSFMRFPGLAPGDPAPNRRHYAKFLRYFEVPNCIAAASLISRAADRLESRVRNS